MQRFFALIAILAIFAGAGYYYVTTKQGQDPSKIFEKAKDLPGVDEARAYIDDKVKNWEPDPEDPQIRVPKNWGRSEVTNGDFTYTVYSPDQNVPPAYYISFAFPKPLIEKSVVIRCWGTDAKKETDVCIVGNNKKLEAYFDLLRFFKAPSFENLTPVVTMD